MKTALPLIVGIILGVIGARFFATAPTPAPEPNPQPVTALPHLPEPYYKVLFENDAVRVVEHVLQPGESEPEHTHPPMVAYFVGGATALITEDDGSTTETTIPTGAFLENLVWWTHSLENVGETPLHSILLEMKGDSGGA